MRKRALELLTSIEMSTPVARAIMSAFLDFPIKQITPMIKEVVTEGREVGLYSLETSNILKEQFGLLKEMEDLQDRMRIFADKINSYQEEVEEEELLKEATPRSDKWN